MDKGQQRVDRVLFLEGRRAARDLLASMAEILTSLESAAGVLARLRQLAAANPHSYAAGVLDVVATLEQLLPPTTAPIDLTEHHA